MSGRFAVPCDAGGDHGRYIDPPVEVGVFGFLHELPPGGLP